ncbi:PIR Superfamily Protein [Plasmodium ovale wallikeri]|uniref:PIR Superfamily Protein n=2 Tax=Plasmodium ovale TaxID=36330 RepID=A0A1A9ASA3_PLAOA|nr:PIR Superfamily Protein [Plasmodium ovale wallikeri]SBT59103.1 PIR Superfamily Protein [Plasmodium ovale wallikeri]SBT73276.1 Plasmodium vivax Vir protein, putative [Plasmodium ovale]
MGSTLDNLAKIDVYKTNEEFVKLFDKLENVCTSIDHSNSCRDSFKYMNIVKTFIPQLKKIFNILYRSKTQGDIYIEEIKLGNLKPCVYYKYWFYHKIINNKLEDTDISELYKLWNQNTIDIYGSLSVDRCKFHAETSEDIKIMKVLYDHIFFFNKENHNFNTLDKIKKCEYCNTLKNYVSKTFIKLPIECAHGSSYAFCREYNDHLKEFIKLEELSSLSCEIGAEISHCPPYSKLQEQGTSGIVSIERVSGNVASITEEDAATSGFAVKIENNKSDAKNVIGEVSVLGISSILFFLYKFTSFGSLVRRQIKWITNMWKNPQGEKEALLLRDSETDNINFDNTQYNLAYNPV